MNKTGTYCNEYVSPQVEIILMSGSVRICEESWEFGSDEIDIPGMTDNDW